MSGALRVCMKHKLQSIDAAQLEHVTGGNGGVDPAGIANLIGGAVTKGLAQNGDQKGAQEAQKWTGIAQQVLGSLSGLMGSAGGATGRDVVIERSLQIGPTHRTMKLAADTPEAAEALDHAGAC